MRDGNQNQHAIAKGLVLSKYGDLAASTRQRFVQMQPYLAQAGIEIEIKPLFDNAYLERLFKGGSRDAAKVLHAYGARLNTVLRGQAFDFLWVHCELFPYLPGVFEQLAACAGKPIIYDFDDAIFHQYDQHANPLVRFILGTKLAPLLKKTTVAFCGNAYLEQYAKRYCAHTEVIPTTVDTEIYVPRQPKPSSEVTLGWMGSPSTWAYCTPLVPLLSSLVNEKHLSVLVVGAGGKVVAPAEFTFREWEEATEIEDLQHMDMGIMPIPDEPWARGKCGYKLIQYMACGLPVIASPVGVNSMIVEHGVNGFLASSEAEWRDAIVTLMENPEMRQRMGQAGREKVKKAYSVQTYGPRVAGLITALCAGGRG